MNIDPFIDPAWNLSCKYNDAPRGVHTAYVCGLDGVACNKLSDIVGSMIGFGITTGPWSGSCWMLLCCVFTLA